MDYYVYSRSSFINRATSFLLLCCLLIISCNIDDAMPQQEEEVVEEPDYGTLMVDFGGGASTYVARRPFYSSDPDEKYNYIGGAQDVTTIYVGVPKSIQATGVYTLEDGLVANYFRASGLLGVSCSTSPIRGEIVLTIDRLDSEKVEGWFSVNFENIYVFQDEPCSVKFAEFSILVGP